LVQHYVDSCRRHKTNHQQKREFFITQKIGIIFT
jgi:hypothetical protein